MLSHKPLKMKGRFPLTKYFQEFSIGDSVTISWELSEPIYYATKLQGRTGKVISKRGRQYVVEVNDLNKPKQYILPAIHLKEIKVKK